MPKLGGGESRLNDRMWSLRRDPVRPFASVVVELAAKDLQLALQTFLRGATATGQP